MIAFKKIHINGTSLQGYLKTPWSFDEAAARIYAASGQDVFDAGDGYKVSFEATGEFNGAKFTLYDYKEDRTIHVGGKHGLDVQALTAELIELLKSVEPKAFTAQTHYDAEGRYSYGSESTEPSRSELLGDIAVVEIAAEVCRKNNLQATCDALLDVAKRVRDRLIK